MSLQAILEAVSASGQAQVREIEAQARRQQEEMLREAQVEAEHLRADARVAALAPAAKEAAHITQRAQAEALQRLVMTREALVDTILQQAQHALAALRADSNYPAVLRQLTEEAFAELQQSPQEAENARLEADPRDQTLIESILPDLAQAVQVSYPLTCWGGVIVTSSDRRVVVINTLESRLERALPYLRRCLVASLEGNTLRA